MRILLVILGPVTTGAIAFVMGRFFKSKLQEIHVLVNARLTEALEKIKRLEKVITDMEEKD